MTGPRQTVTGALAAKANGGNGDAKPGTTVAVKHPLERMLDTFRPGVEKQLVRHIPAEYFLRTVLTGLRRSPQLAEIAKDPEGRASIGVALMEAARTGLIPFTEEAAIVPYGKRAAFIPQYKGIKKLWLNSGQVTAIEARLIYANDDWALGYGDGGGFYHRPKLINPDGTDADRGKPVLAYCYCVLKGGERTSVTTVTRTQAEHIRDSYSRSYQNAEKSWYGKPPKRDSPWHLEFDAMWVKSAVRQHADNAPKSAQLTVLLLAASRDDVHAPAAAAPPRPADVGLPEEDPNIWEADVVDDVADASGEGGWPQDPPGGEDSGQGGAAAPFDRKRAMSQLQATFRDLGWGGNQFADRRRAVGAMLGRPNPEMPPLPITSLAELDDTQLGDAARQLADIKASDAGSAEQVREGLTQLATAGGWVDPAGQPAGDPQ